MNSSPKITRSHLERAALIYIRQSTLAQVRENTESTARQYALADTAVALGWDRGDVQISALGRPLLPSTGCGRDPGSARTTPEGPLWCSNDATVEDPARP